jgi:hypothetical protein
MSASATAPPSRPSTVDRRVFLVFAVVLFGLIGLVYHTSLKHVPRADQWILLLDTIDQHDFLDLVAHSYSYSRTRVIYAGDTQLFRPLFFVLLAAERAAFGTDFRLWHGAGVLLHFAASLLLLRCMLRLYALAVPDAGPPAEARSWWRRWPPLRLLPYALTLFFALNFAVAEQVIWFNINGYILFAVFVLGSFLLLLEAVANSALSERRRRFCLLGAWLLTLLGAFTYEMGQFYAVLAGLFLAAVGGCIRRAALLAVAFLGIALLYQAANHLDRRLHQGQYTDDVAFRDIHEKLFTPMSAEHLKRYASLAVVQPFLPLHCKVQMHPMGKALLGEPLWNGEVKRDTAWRLSLAVFGLWVLLALAGLLRLLAARRWTWLAVAAFALGIAGIHMGLIVFGRMNLRPVPIYLHLNHYYIYLTLLFMLLALAALLGALRSLRPAFSHVVNTAAGVLAVGLLVLCVPSGLQVHKLNADTARMFKPYRWMNDSLRAFVRAHQAEEDFSFALRLDPGDGLPSVTGVPCPVILYKRYIDNSNPKYVVWFAGFRARALPADEWRRRHPGDAAALCPELVQVGAPYHIFRHRDRYYALSYNAAIAFVYSRQRDHFPGALQDETLDGLRRQIEARKIAGQTAGRLVLPPRSAWSIRTGPAKCGAPLRRREEHGWHCWRCAGWSSSTAAARSWMASISTWTPARWSACSAPMARARPPASA